ncbi:MAG: GH1 family beta-glucosidase [Phycisphaerales bacterium]
MTFPKDFVWGAATSAYQVEGGWNAEGKGPSNWDAFCHGHVPAGSVGNIPGQVYTPGNVLHDQTGDVACDHYHRSAEDVRLMSQIGLRAYRFSISWARVMPDGVGRINEPGMAFYDRLVDQLLAAGITPWVTLFHWDLPLALWQRGAWHNRESAEWFAEYAQVVVDRLSDRVRHWITINEPQIFLGPGEHEGLQTSNARAGHAQRLIAAHHVLLAHGRAVQVIRARAKSPPIVGWAPIGRVRAPASDSPADIEAARRATLGVLHRDFWNNTWFADPVVLGHYPEDGLRLYGSDAPRPHAGDMETIRQPLDFYGINVYDAELYRACAPHAANPLGPTAEIERVPFGPGHPRTAIGWFTHPPALYWGPKFLYERYRLPIVVTENGLSNTDWVAADGGVHDPQRIDYTRRYLIELRRAIADGTPVAGYFHWSLLDNFEWAQGYRERFGLIHVDFATLKRTLKDSAHWYRTVIESGGANL